MLLQASEYSVELDRPLWDFAVEIQSLRDSGLSNSDLRWLVCHSLVQTACEVRPNGHSGRSFRRTSALTLSEKTCFVLTEAGAALARKGGLPTEQGEGNRDLKIAVVGAVRIPHWDGECHELRVGGRLVKQFKVPAPNQETILAVFQEENWPRRIDDPLRPSARLDAKRRLHDTIVTLNRNHEHRIIRFAGDGRGLGVRWELV
jgi:hypothetical protein